MTYTVKEKNGKFHLYNTSTKRMLSRSYDSPVEAKASITRVNKRGKGIKKYHNCCRSHGCGKKNKKKTTKVANKTTKVAKKTTKPKPKMRTPMKKKIKKKKRRVALTQPVNNAGSGNIKLTKNSGEGQRKAFKFLASDKFEKRYRRLERYGKDIPYTAF